ncbi:MAG: DUF362 domain-containing protein [Erysipelotrichaceae bacterium]|nr:DUF362 domain-containing protein [Erysipelotrichaceae bacterium]
MDKAKVYFTDLRTDDKHNLLDKLERLVRKAGIEQIDFKDKYVCIKLHFGERGNLAYIRPNYARRLVDVIKKLGGKPYLSDCNTLYVGGRSNGLDHLETAYENGFNPLTVGCHIVIADGIKGLDECLVPINGDHVKEAKIGQAIMDAGVFISLTHFKGHEGAGFGGTLKNIGMGCGSRAGKMEMHTSGKPKVTAEKCRSCGTCLRNCAHDAIAFNQEHKAEIDLTKCVGCGRCIGSCPFDAIKPMNWHSSELLNEKIAEYTYAVVKDRPCFHISLVMDVSPNCDCHSENDAAIINDIGMFASFDPVALDQACADAVNQAPINPQSMLGDVQHPYHDHFKDIHPNTNWQAGIAHAEKLGLGTHEYELIKV